MERTPYDREDWEGERMPWPKNYFGAVIKSASPTEPPMRDPSDPRREAGKVAQE